MQPEGTNTMADTATAALELSLTRLIEAPRALVFKAWTDPALTVRWWGPRGFSVVECQIDPRPGGAYRKVMRSPEGTLHRLRGTYREVVAPERLRFTFAWEDEQGGLGPQTLVTVTLTEQGGKTALELHQSGFETITARDLHQAGWSSSLDGLGEFAFSQRGN
jgi:uncharacterized protein YndB with AHSA1/START domain